MTEREMIEAAYLRWSEGWTALHPSALADPDHVPYVFRGEAMVPSPLGVLGAWARVSVQHTASQQSTMGSAPSRKFVRRGNVFVQLFAPVNTGASLLAGLADDARTALEGHRTGDLVFHSGRTEEGADDPPWATVSVIVAFRYNDNR